MMTKLYDKTFKILICLFLAGIPFVVFPEGTKQLRPNNAINGKIYYVKNLIYTSDPSVSNDYRIHVNIKSPGEKIYYGVTPSSVNYPVVFRILDPSGTPVQSNTISKTIGCPGYIETYAQAVAGPSVISPSGYNALSFTPTTTGDYLVDFDLGILQVDWFDFDITVIDTTLTPLTPTDGRAWCKVWNIYAGQPGAPGCMATLYVYPQDSVVTSINLNGLNSISALISLNRNGIFPPPVSWLESRRSQIVTGWALGYLEHKIFLNNPDSTIYPTGHLGVINPSSLIITPNCDGTVAIGFSVNKSGWIELQVHLDPDPGIQPVDVIISDSVHIGYNTIIWSGFNGLGLPTNNGVPFHIRLFFQNGLTNLPIGQTYSNPSGFLVQLKRPSGSTPLLYWDDRLIFPTNFNLNGCLGVLPNTGCHTWSYSWPAPSYITNTWWYASSANVVSNSYLFKRSLHSITDTSICEGDTILWHGQSYYSAGTFNINNSSILTGCDSSYTLNLTLKPSPIVVLSPDTSICTGQSIVFDAGYCAGCSYQWDNLALGQMNIGSNQTYTATTAGIYRVTVTGNNGCKGRDTVTVVMGQPITIDVTITSSATTACDGIPVTFTAAALNPGASPLYQWKVNTVNVGSNNTVFTYAPSNGDVVTCELTSSLVSCISVNPVISNAIAITVIPYLPVVVSISPSGNPVCAGILVNFTAIPVNGGITPQYQWKVNGLIVGTNSPGYSYVPINGDAITCTLNSNVLCPTGNPAISNTVTMTVKPILPVGVSIVASSNPFCLGSTITFTATTVNGGTIPVFQWKVNGINAGTNNSVFIYSPANNDVVTCSMLSSEICTTGNPAQSNPITMVVNANLPAGITISASSNPFCPGSAVTFTASPVNGGSNPTYQWKVNGINSGTNSPSFSYVPANNDSVRCVITSNLSCVIGNPASSAKIIMIGSLAPNVAFSACFDTVTTVNAKPFQLKGGLPIGGTYSGPGVNSSTGIFSPSVAGTGVKTINYSYINVHDCGASKSKSIVVQPYPSFTCGNNLVDTRDNKVYPTVQIGTQCWMSKNLDFGLAIANTIHQADNCIAEKYCYNGTVANCSQYGGLYQWDELMKFDDSPAGQGLCPPGWHVPTETDWTSLMNYYLGNGRAGRPLQDTIINGFKALRSGVFYLNSSWSFMDFATILWSSTSSGQSKAISHGMNLYNFSVSLYPASRANAFGMRCLRD